MRMKKRFLLPTDNWGIKSKLSRVIVNAHVDRRGLLLVYDSKGYPQYLGKA